MQIAYDEATKGMHTCEGGPFGAVLVKGNQLIASSHNTVLLTNDPTAHAEINVIRMASKKLNTFDLSDLTLYTTCQPCPMCMGAILWARIDKVYYGATKDDAKEGGFDDNLFYEMLQNNSLNLEQIDHKENKELFSIWNKKEDKQIY